MRWDPVLVGVLRVSAENSLRVQHDLPKHLALLHVLVGRTYVLQRKSMVDDRLEASGEHMAEYFMEFAHRAHVRPQQ